MIDQYGIKNIFLQEMWFGMDGTGERSCFCDNCVKKFSKLEKREFTRDSLFKAISKDPKLKERWYKFHFDTEMNIIAELKKMVGKDGNVIWHNESETDRSFLENDKARTKKLWIDDMSLFPDESIFARKPTDDMDPFFVYRDVAPFVQKFGNEKTCLEYYSLYGMVGLDRKVTRSDIVNIYLAAKAAGMRNLLVEQDIMIDWADDKSPGVWNAIQETYSKYEPLFIGANYVGESTALNWEKDKGYSGQWKNGNWDIVIAGVSLYDQRSRLELNTHGKKAYDVSGKQVQGNVFYLNPGDIEVFIIH